MDLPQPVRPYRIVFRRAHSTEWSRKNTVLLPGEPGMESDTGRIKFGDGELGWNALEYFVGETTEDIGLEEHINSPTPHSVYDNGPSLLLLYENKKV